MDITKHSISFLLFLWKLAGTFIVVVLILLGALGFFLHYDGDRRSKEALPEIRKAADENAEIFKKVSKFVVDGRVNAIVSSDFRSGSGFLVNYQNRATIETRTIDALTADENAKFEKMFWGGDLQSVFYMSGGRVCIFEFRTFAVAKVIKGNGPHIGRQYGLKVPREYRNGLLLFSNCNRGICDVESGVNKGIDYKE